MLRFFMYFFPRSEFCMWCENEKAKIIAPCSSNTPDEKKMNQIIARVKEYTRLTFSITANTVFNDSEFILVFIY